MESKTRGILDTPPSRSMTAVSGASLSTALTKPASSRRKAGTTTTLLRPLLIPLLQHFQHQLHRHQHGIVAMHQPSFGEAAEVVDQRDVELGLRRAAFSCRDDAGADRQFGRERHHAAAVGEFRADSAADAAMNPGMEDAVLPAKNVQRAGKILVRA